MESVTLDFLGDQENFTIASTQKTPPPFRESDDLDVLGNLENFTIASIRT